MGTFRPIADVQLRCEKAGVPRSNSHDPLIKPPSSEFLADLLLSLRRRRKAISRHVSNIAVVTVLERTDGEELEKLEIDCMPIHPNHTKVRLFAWDDRWIWVDARSMIGSTKGWTWEFTAQGRAIGGVGGRTLVQALEASIAAASPVEQHNAAMLKDIWQPLLAVGPRAVQ